jgi:hypothetical protein
MAMKETANSLRAYFIVVGIFAVLGNFSGLTVEGLPLIVKVFSVVGLALAGALIYFGITIHVQLASGGKKIVHVLHFLLGLQALTALLYVINKNFVITGWVVLAISVAILYYLLASVKRLAAESSPDVAPVQTPTIDNE